MKNLHSKKITKQIIVIIAIIMLCNFTMPIYTYASTDTDSGGTILPYIAKFLCFVPDSLTTLLQNLFTDTSKVDGENNYKIYYSPAIIFSGKVPALDTNFFKSSTEDDLNATLGGKVHWNVLFSADMRYEANIFYEGIKNNTDILNSYFEDYGYNDENSTHLKETYIKEAASVINGKQYYNYTAIVPWKTGEGKEYSLLVYGIAPQELTERDGEEYAKYKVGVILKDGIVKKKYTSSAIILQPIIASWYRVFRRIALVGLLSVLLYIGIKIVLSSTSAENKSKYKKMLMDWFAAVCILFMLHTIMNLIVIVVNQIGNAISSSVIGTDGEDVLLTTIRQKIAGGISWSVVITEVIIYLVITIYTIIFTIQYIRRLVYLAFLTMIAPLITLTYPLDKIKDSKAQAFDAWIKDYVFFSLLQVIHLLLYYILVGSSTQMAEEGNWIYALIMIGFLTQAEKIVKKMFGFEKSKSMGAIGAAATGALVTNLINKVKTASKSKGGNSGTGENKESSKPVRTVEKAKLAGLKAGTVEANTNEQRQEGSLAGARMANVPSEGTSETNAQKGEAFRRGELAQEETQQSNAAGGSMPRRNVWNGVKAVSKKYVGPAIRTVAGGAGALVGGTIGFAAGVAQGDMGKALGGTAGGLAAGNAVGQKAVNGAGKVIDTAVNIDRPFRDIAKTYHEGAYGEENGKKE